MNEGKPKSPFPSKTCEHKWVYMDSKKYSQYNGYCSTFTRIDKFYCEKCLEIKEIKKVDSSRDTPDWY